MLKASERIDRIVRTIVFIYLFPAFPGSVILLAYLQHNKISSWWVALYFCSLSFIFIPLYLFLHGKQTALEKLEKPDKHSSHGVV
jgi:hypothetical protein